MLAFFPTLFPDELLYSGIARYHLMSGSFAQKQSVYNLFDNKLVCSTADLPTHLKYLCRNLNNLYTAEQLIKNHTLYTYYSKFLTKEKAKHIFLLMNEGSPYGAVHILLGLVSSSVKLPRYLRYCKECITEDTVRYNEPYWHRSHQLPGVYFCPIHKSELIHTNILCSTRDHKFKFVPLIQVKKNQSKKRFVSPNWRDLLIKIAEYSSQMLKNDGNDYTDIFKIYRTYLNKRGYITVRGRVRFKHLISDFCNFFSIDLLALLNCNIEHKNNDTWFHKIVRGENTGSHPLRHVLLHIFLGLKLNQQQFGQLDLPFGQGPWPCLNKAAGHFMKNIISAVYITRDSKSGSPVGTFKCSCGFEYSRKGPDNSMEDRYRIGRIKSFGPVWMKKLNQYNQQDLSLREKGRLLGVDPLTVKKYTNHPLQKYQSIDEQNHQKEKNGRRERYLVSKKEAEDINISKRELNREDYIWVYKHDRKWLEQNKPKSKRVLKKSVIVDWQERDKVVLNGVNKALKILLNENKPKRITISELSRNMEENIGRFLHRCLNKLPNTREYLKLIVETTEQYQIRRLEWAANELKKESFKIHGWRLLKKAGLNRPLKERVETKYQDLIAEHEIFESGRLNG
ncbi:MAG TPA: TnsD family Tn7-like transposition protein [Bacillus sp. (in: firmicutes)]|uniref:TnsD family Tn7-like transposition protein n=1 Tax=Bacillus litorisediminis TaxID=2922713 RepID=UPI001FB03AE1|nr:TnsD family Tn7-like transposition protein [Bacillus litorisediminis]HWO75985.1 TnsD family Tn7-like transposition protein [Bacillus sp. (in: firmicutes)]